MARPSLPSPESIQARYDDILRQNLSLDLTRGKPAAEQLQLSNGLLNLTLDEIEEFSEVDVRNYGGLAGLEGVKQLFAQILEVPSSNVIVGGNSSLTMMYDYICRGVQFGVPGGHQPWGQSGNRKFICPTPGYDRHFLITQHLGFELISVDMTDQGPNMDQVESLVAADPEIKGIWCVPKYSNPTGTCFSPDVVRRLAQMNTAADDFRIMWDNAYAEHCFDGNQIELANILQLCIDAGNENRVIEFASTSKMTYPGAGVAAMAASDENIKHCLHHLSVQSIGPDKINQLRHLKLFPDISELRRHMQHHAALLQPKFELVNTVLQRELGQFEIASWTQPGGGYFISLDIPQGKAAATIESAKNAGVSLTKAGAPFPYGIDPQDRNIRIAPTFATLQELEIAVEVLCVCVLLNCCADST